MTAGAVTPQAGSGALSRPSGGTAVSPGGSRQKKQSGWEGGCPQISSSSIPDGHPGSQLGCKHLRSPCLEAWSPKHGPQGPDRREEGGRASTEGL